MLKMGEQCLLSQRRYWHALAQVKSSTTVDVTGDQEVSLSGHQDSLVAVLVELIENALNHG